MRAARQPAQHPMLVGDDRMTAPPWVDFFDLIALFQRSAAALPGSPSFGSDAAAAAGGVGIGELYRNGSVVCVRVA